MQITQGAKGSENELANSDIFYYLLHKDNVKIKKIYNIY